MAYPIVETELMRVFRENPGQWFTVLELSQRISRSLGPIRASLSYLLHAGGIEARLFDRPDIRYASRRPYEYRLAKGP